MNHVATFCRLIFLCGNYTTVKWMYENSTIPILEPIVLRMSGYRSFFVNIDLDQRYKLVDVNSDKHSLIIYMFDNDPVMKINTFGLQHDLKPYYHYLFASRDINDTTLSNKLITFAIQYKLDNIALMIINPNETFQLSRIIYDQRVASKIPGLAFNDCDKMFYAKTKDLKREDIYVYIRPDPPRAINVASRNKVGNEVIRIGGRDAYLASLIPIKINITLKLWTFRLSAFDTLKGYSANRKYLFLFLKEFLETIYEDDNLTPKQLDCMQFIRNADVIE